MKKERFTGALKKAVRQAYGIETAVTVPTLDPETLRHQGLTDRITSTIDYSLLAIIYGSTIAYGFYKAATKVPEIIDQISLVYSNVSQYIQPFVSS